MNKRVGSGSTPPSDDDDVQRPGKRRHRRGWRIFFGVVATIVLVAGGVAYWALDRFVIDHVEIADVAAHEASVTTITTTTTAVAIVTPIVSAATAATAATDAPADAPTTTADPSPVIEITKVVTGTGDDTVTSYVADVTLTDATQLRAGFADNAFGTNIVQNTSTIAEFYGAAFAINGDYYGFRESGIMIRNGVIYRDDGVRTGLAFFTDGTMTVYDETSTTADELLAAGAWNTLSFGPALVDDGRIVDGIEEVEVDTNIGNHSIQGDQPRTAIGMISANHFVFVVVDGRSAGYSKGVTMTELAQIFVDLGATEAYNLDGGGSATMYADGHLVNVPLGKGKERGTSDILYLA